jgi:hypothetical protein
VTLDLKFYVIVYVFHLGAEFVTKLTFLLFVVLGSVCVLCGFCEFFLPLPFAAFILCYCVVKISL